METWKFRQYIQERRSTHKRRMWYPQKGVLVTSAVLPALVIASTITATEITVYRTHLNPSHFFLFYSTFGFPLVRSSSDLLLLTAQGNPREVFTVHQFSLDINPLDTARRAASDKFNSHGKDP